MLLELIEYCRYEILYYILSYTLNTHFYAFNLNGKDKKRGGRLPNVTHSLHNVIKILYDIALNVNKKDRSKNVFLNESIQEIIENLSVQEGLSLIATANQYRLIKSFSTILDRKEINLHDDLSTFLSSFKSVHTRISYNHNLKRYLDYCNSLNIDPRLATYETARNFVLFLTNNRKSSVVIRQTISIVKSFYDYMLSIHELHVSNPFSHKALLPRKERIKPLVISTQQEYDLIMSEYSMDTSKKALLYALSIITKYGVRISAFHKATVLNRNLVRITEYKGKEKTIHFESRDIERLERVARYYKTRESLEVNLINFLKKCYEKGITDNAYSPHDFRHLFACNFYKTTKDIVGLSVILNHTSIAVTDTYLTDLKRNIGNETRTEECFVPSISEYNKILTKYIVK
jgi:site-specific recombinase XerD